MSTLDAGFYFVEHQNVPMHIGSLAIFEGPAPSYADFARLLEARLPLVPRYRQVVRTAPLQVFRPAWFDDQHFEVGYHVRHTGVPPPGTAEQVRAQAARIFGQRLDRDRPLWEAWLIEGIEDGRWAILSKVHHCVVDGIGGSDLMTVLFDLEPRPEPPEPAHWQPEPEPSQVEVLASSALHALARPIQQLSGAPAGLRERLPTRDHLADFGRGLTATLRRLTVPSAHALNGPIGPHRRWAWTKASLSEVKQVRHALGGTVNDVLLAAVSRGFRDLLRARGEIPPGIVVRALVPVSVRGQDQQGEYTNKISAVFANLPVSEPDPGRRLGLLTEQMTHLKQTNQAVGAEILTGMLGFAAPTLLALGSRAAFRIPQPLVQTVTTNVPGPGFPLFVLGRQMTEVYPYVPIGTNLRIAVAIFSYLGEVTFGITGDYEAVPDLDILTSGISAGLAEMAELAGVKPKPRQEPAPTPAAATQATPGKNAAAEQAAPGETQAPPGQNAAEQAEGTAAEQAAPAKNAAAKQAARAKNAAAEQAAPAKNAAAKQSPRAKNAGAKNAAPGKKTAGKKATGPDNGRGKKAAKLPVS